MMSLSKAALSSAEFERAWHWGKIMSIGEAKSLMPRRRVDRFEPGERPGHETENIRE